MRRAPRLDGGLRLRRERGATGAEYALVASLIAVIIVGAVQVIGTQVAGFFSSIAPAL